ncbi:hypothetical protein LTR09_001059 [Extremus antarcticus]|uniref:WD40 repeat-like protein n=1 Tax=Extremus antarcticus TaxID=702011 RepID=A0AAJ0LWJ8_9PEZI|nr:hypothetical protein LTR09_001059 [Extremus antarcticus]
MPSTRQVTKVQPSPTSIHQQSFQFPDHAHLLITTRGHIFSWDATGVHTIFRTSKNGIVAAREANDGSGVLAVADKHVIVLHDTKRGQERSWGLQANDDEVRHLEYTSDAKSLFLSTNLTADIQQYSAEQSRLLSPSKAHASPPVALAVSPTGHLMVSASDKPPTVYLSDLAHNSAPVLIESRASVAPVTVVAFHPERPNIFLLAFTDGTVAAFDATKIARKETGSFSNQERVNRGEICRFAKLHRPTMDGNRTMCVEDAAFLPGHKSRAVTVGRDGKCRLIDFADRGNVLRTWHAHAPVTSVSVLPRKATVSDQPATTSGKHKRAASSSVHADNVIAVGRVDGTIQIYDSVGLLLEQKSLRGPGNQVISVDWVQGKSPKPISDTIVARGVDPLPEISSADLGTAHVVTGGDSNTRQEAVTQKRRHTTFEHVGLPPGLRKPRAPAQPTPQVPRQFAIHPDEMDEGTVRHTPLPRGNQQSPPNQGQYLDLFSPVKPVGPINDDGELKRVASPPRSRPKVSSQTFVKSPEPAAAGLDTAIAKPRNLGLFPSTDSSHSTGLEEPQSRPQASLLARATPKLKSMRGTSRSSTFQAQSHAPANSNAKILADLRRMGATQPTKNQGGPHAGSGIAGSSGRHRNAVPKKSKLHLFHRPTAHVETDQDSMHAMRAYEEVHSKRGWPEDSHQGSSLDDDIWLTSDNEHATEPQRNRRRRPIERPPARQTSRSRMVSGGTTSTAPPVPAASSSKPATKLYAVDGSTDEEMFTAETYLSPDGTLSPSSKDIQTLCPRSSSLSPRKHHHSARKRMRRSPLHQERALREVPLNTVSGHAKSPWIQAKASKIAPSQVAELGDTRILHDDGFQENENQKAEVPHCSVCSPTRSRVHELEGEVARLRGEVLALKATMRRHGVPLPRSLR